MIWILQATNVGPITRDLKTSTTSSWNFAESSPYFRFITTILIMIFVFRRYWAKVMQLWWFKWLLHVLNNCYNVFNNYCNVSNNYCNDLNNCCNVSNNYCRTNWSSTSVMWSAQFCEGDQIQNQVVQVLSNFKFCEGDQNQVVQHCQIIQFKVLWSFQNWQNSSLQLPQDKFWRGDLVAAVTKRWL